MKESYEMGLTQDVLQHEVLTLPFAEGKVDPAARVAAGEISADKIEELKNRIINGEYTTNVDPYAVPCYCIDCRPKVDGLATIGAKAAAGTGTLVVADALTYNRYRRPGEKAPDHHMRMFNALRHDYQVGGHGDNLNKPDGFCGCGAWDKMDPPAPNPSIFDFAERNSQVLFDTIEALGAKVTMSLAHKIGQNVSALRKEGYAVSGSAIQKACKEASGDGSIVTLDGEQKGVLAVIMTTPGEVLNEQRILDDFGPDYQVFEISAWAIKNGAEVTSETPEEALEKYVAGLFYNLAASGVIVGPDMQVIVQ